MAQFVAGSVAPEIIQIGTTEIGIAAGLAGFGNLLLVMLIFVSLAVIVWTAYEGWRYGYAEGRAI